MDRDEIIDKLNKSFQNNSINANEYIPLLSEFLEKKYPNKASEIIQLIISKPVLLGETIQTVKDYFIKEYNICTLNKIINGNYVHLCFLK